MSTSRLAPLVLPLLVVVAGSAGCASQPSLRGAGRDQTVLWTHAVEADPAPTPQPLSEVEAKERAGEHEHAHRCESEARRLRERKGPAVGWSLMRACIARPDFSDLEVLLSPRWIDDVKQSPDVALMIAHVIAVRGGDVNGDLRLLRRAKVPVYTLRSALAEPERYRGRYVLMRGSAVSGLGGGGAYAVNIKETRVMAESEYVPVGPRFVSKTNVDTTDRNGPSILPGRKEDAGRSEQQKVEVLHNVSVETGLEVIGRLGGEDPFFEPAIDYVVVLRFEGLREAPGKGEDLGVAEVVDVFEPENGMFARLAR
jgi:hypothetical protein